MNWQEVCEHPSLQDLPFKIELNEWGQIVMSPASIQHVVFQGCIADLLKSLMKQGKTLQEFPVETSENIKAPDVVWLSQERFMQVRQQVASPIAPEICIEVMSPGNTKKQLLHKGTLYFAAGAKEFWLCHENGLMEFYDSAGKLANSVLVPNFPNKIVIE